MKIYSKLNNVRSLKLQMIKHYMGGTDSLRKSGFDIIQDKSTENASGYNNVDVDQEMADMAQNSLLFKFAARKLNFYFRSIQSVIKGGS